MRLRWVLDAVSFFENLECIFWRKTGVDGLAPEAISASAKFGISIPPQLSLPVFQQYNATVGAFVCFYRSG